VLDSVAVKVLCFDTLLQVLIPREMKELSGEARGETRWATRAEANDNAETRRPRRGTPPRVFFQKSSDFLDYKGVAVFGMAKEFATVSKERTYVWRVGGASS
jgi:hypothetical protein